MKYFFTVFLLEKNVFGISCKRINLHEMSKPISGESTAENINISLSFAEFAERVVKINDIYLPIFIYGIRGLSLNMLMVISADDKGVMFLLPPI